MKDLQVYLTELELFIECVENNSCQLSEHFSKQKDTPMEIIMDIFENQAFNAKGCLHGIKEEIKDLKNQLKEQTQ